MSYLVTIKSLYAINGLVAVLLYCPQIYRAWKQSGPGHSVSLITFGGWGIGSLITALYAFLVVQDPVFTAVSLGNMAGSVTVFGISAVRRLIAINRPASPSGDSSLPGRPAGTLSQ